LRSSSLRWVALLTSWAFVLFPRPGAPAVPDRVRIAEMPFFSHAPLYIAREEGYFAEQNIDAEFIPIARTNASLVALISGELDVMTSVPSSGLFNAIAQGGGMRFVADKGHASPGECSPWALLVRPDLLGPGGQLAPERLRGERIPIHPHTYGQFLVEKALKQIGLTAADVNATDIPIPLLIRAFQDKTIGLAILAEADLVRVLKSKSAVVWKQLTEIQPTSQFSALVFAPRLLGKDREVGVRVLMAYLKGVRRYNTGKTPRNVEILARSMHRDPQEILEACWTPIRSDGRIVAPEWNEFQTWAIARKDMDRALPLDRFIDSTLVEEAVRRLDRAQRR
jgi:NitT/TauT family transport system substrate-binding protein